jgi:hypothetical protein
VPVAIYLALAAGVTLVAVIALRETVGVSLRAIDDADRAKVAAEDRVDA